MALSDWVDDTEQLSKSDWVDETPATNIHQPQLKQVQPQERSIGGFVKNIGSDIYDVGSGLLNAVTHPIDTVTGIGGLAVGASSLAQKKMGLLDAHMKAGNEEAAKEMARPFAKAFDNPLGIPEQIADYAYEKPVTSALNLSLGLGAASKAAGLANATRVAKGLATASDYTNPISVASKVAVAPLNAVSKTSLPEEIYARTMKIPPGSLNTATRGKVLNTLVRDEQLPLGGKTVDKMNKIVNEIENKITPIIDDASLAGEEINISKVSGALDNLKKQYSNRLNPQEYYDVIDNVKMNITEHEFLKRVQQADGTVIPSTQMSLSDAHSLKKGIYQEIGDYYKKFQKPETGRVGIKNDVDAVAQAKVAEVLRTEILDNPSIPNSVKEALKRESGILTSRKWVERATNRSGNLDPISLSSMLFGTLTGNGLPSTIAWRVAASQPVLSRLAIAIGKTRTGFSPTTSNTVNALFQTDRAINPKKDDIPEKTVDYLFQ